jgi:hypothetical protein
MRRRPRPACRPAAVHPKPVSNKNNYLDHLPPTFSLEPYDMPEMVYEKPIEIGEMVFAWDEYMIEKKRILIGEYMGKISNSIQMLYMVGKDNVQYRFISRTNPLINENK